MRDDGHAGGGRGAARRRPGPRVRPAAGIPAAGHRARPAPRRRRPAPTPAERATTWWTSALRFLGCTGHAFEMAVVFGDEIELRARVAAGRRRQPGRHAAPDGQPRRTGSVRCWPAALGARPSWPAAARRAELNFRTACEVADVLRQAARPRRARARRAGRELRALERARPADRAARARRSRARCGSPSSARSSRCSPASRASPRALDDRQGADAARPTTRSSPISSSRTAPAWWDGGRAGRLLGRGARRRTAVRAARRRGGPRGAARPRRLRRSQVTVDERPLARASPRSPWRRAGRPPRPRRWSTTSAASRYPTRSGTSPAR